MKHDSSLNYISVCDEKCIIDETQSSSSVATCKVPAISTIYSNANFKISTESENLKAGNFFGTATDFELAFDDKMLETPSDSSSTCNLGMQFKEGHVGLLS